MYGCASMYGCFGAPHPCSANMLRVLRCHAAGALHSYSSTRLFGRHPCSQLVSVTCVACACSWGWATHGLLIIISTGVPWVSCRDPPVCSRCPGSVASVAERQLVLCWVVLRCGVWWCVVHVVVWIVSSLRFVMCPLATFLSFFFFWKNKKCFSPPYLELKPFRVQNVSSLFEKNVIILGWCIFYRFPSLPF